MFAEKILSFCVTTIYKYYTGMTTVSPAQWRAPRVPQEMPSSYGTL
jgi:hypothetical protein